MRLLMNTKEVYHIHNTLYDNIKNRCRTCGMFHGTKIQNLFENTNSKSIFLNK